MRTQKWENSLPFFLPSFMHACMHSRQFFSTITLLYCTFIVGPGETISYLGLVLELAKCNPSTYMYVIDLVMVYKVLRYCSTACKIQGR